MCAALGVASVAAAQFTPGYSATDGDGNAEAAHTLVVRIDSTPPVTSAALADPPNARGWNNRDVAVSFVATDNAGGSGVDAIRYTLSGAQSGAGTLPPDGAIGISAEGITTVTYSAADRAGNQEAARVLQVAIDKTAPVISGMPAAGCSLWPPNHTMVQVATISAGGGASPLGTFAVVVSSSEPAGAGQSDASIAGSGAAPRAVSLRAERDGHSPGRVYTINVSATDDAGNVANASAICVVPHDKGR